MADKANVKLNGVDLQNVLKLAKEMEEDSSRADELAEFTRGCRVSWNTGFNSQAYTRDVPPAGYDEPEWLGGANKAMAASEAVLGAIGGCIATGFAANASLEDVEIHELEVEVVGQIDLPSFFGLREGNPGHKHVDVTIFVNVDDDTDEELLNEISRRAFELSPVVNTVRHPVEIDYSVRRTG